MHGLYRYYMQKSDSHVCNAWNILLPFLLREVGHWLALLLFCGRVEARTRLSSNVAQQKASPA